MSAGVEISESSSARVKRSAAPLGLAVEVGANRLQEERERHDEEEALDEERRPIGEGAEPKHRGHEEGEAEEAGEERGCEERHVAERTPRRLHESDRDRD